MATAKKLPSGSWRCQVFSHRDKNGKRVYKSFTAPTKKQAELLAAQYMNDVNTKKTGTITVEDAINRYITSKTGVLSPSTIRGYRQMQGKYYDSLAPMDIFRITTEDLQLFVSGITGTVSAKTVSNAYGLLSSAITMFRPDAVFRVSLPKKIRKKNHAPSSSDIQALFLAAEGDIQVCIALAAFGSMRRGEICALKYSDISGNTISVHADMVENEHNKFEYKEIPKTSDSVRTVILPEAVIGLINALECHDDGFIIHRTPNAVTHAFTRLRNRQGLTICLHDLRHYYASIGAVLGVPDTYLSQFGGWRPGSSVMKEVYQGTMKDMSEQYAADMVSHFERIMQHEMQHEK